MEALNSMLLEEAFSVGASGMGKADGYPNGIILLETDDTETETRTVASTLESLDLSQTQAILEGGLQELRVTANRLLLERANSQLRPKLMTKLDKYVTNVRDRDYLDAYYFEQRDKYIGKAVELLYGDGSNLGPPLCKGATTLLENLEESYEKAQALRSGNLFSTFDEAGDLACKLDEGGLTTVQFITNVKDILDVFQKLLEMASGLPIVGTLARFLNKPVDFLVKLMEKHLVPIRDKLKDDYVPKFRLACKFRKMVVRRVGYAVEAIRVLKLQAFPANKAAEMVGLAMNVCGWLPPVALLADNALTGAVAVDGLFGATTDFVREIISWIEGLIPESILKKMAEANKVMNFIFLPVRKTKAALFGVYKVCIPFIKCWEFSLRDLLAALTGFLEKIFSFALKPFEPLVEKAVAPVKRQLEKAFKTLMPSPEVHFDGLTGMFQGNGSLMVLVQQLFKTDTEETFSGQIEKSMELTKKQAGYCYSYGTELPLAHAICKDISEKYGPARTPYERLGSLSSGVFFFWIVCQKLCNSACSRCFRWSFVVTDAAVGAGVCRFAKSNAYYEVKNPTSVSGPKACKDVGEYQPDTFMEHVESGLCKDMGAFPEIKEAEACKKACFVDGGAGEYCCVLLARIAA
ncbi:unnamed protein product [Effrenium voratum]|nr:unnamed protein product [Effrenium voratum]